MLEGGHGATAQQDMTKCSRFFSLQALATGAFNVWAARRVWLRQNVGGFFVACFGNWGVQRLGN